MNNINYHLEMIYIQEDLQNISENKLTDFIKNMLPQNKMKSLLSKVKTLDSINNGKNLFKFADKVKAFAKGFPAISLDKIESFSKDKIKNFTQMKKTSTTILQNSVPKISKKGLDAASTFLAISSIVDKKGSKISQKDNLKQHIKKFVFKLRSFENTIDSTYEEKEKKTMLQKEDISDFLVAIAIASSIIGLVVAIGTGTYGILVAVASMVTFGNFVFIILLSTLIIAILAIPKN